MRNAAAPKEHVAFRENANAFKENVAQAINAHAGQNLDAKIVDALSKTIGKIISKLSPSIKDGLNFVLEAESN